MKNQFFKYFLFTLILSFSAQAQWSRDTVVTASRENIYQLSPAQFQSSVMAGRKHALFYPVTASELLIPYNPMKDFFESGERDPVRVLLFKLAKIVSPFKSINEVYDWLGLHDFPAHPQNESPNPLPTLSVHERSSPMGATIMATEHGEAMTFGCAACHTGDLFGVKVLGLTNRFPRANEFFAEGKRVAPFVNSFVFKDLLKTTEGERLMLISSKNAMNYVGTKKPQVLGLDTSLAQVAISLGRREPDAYATRSKSYKKPRPNKLEKMVADSKPAVWWNVKYKNRWLSDGSIVSGNPVHTNFLWNEIGRGTDLKKLEAWMHESDDIIRDLTAAVFATKPPRYEKFFGVNSIDIARAQRGEKHYLQSCSRCHGVYQKGWDLPGVKDAEAKIQNIKLTYHTKTPVRDVGTDPGRYLGMREFAADLNRLQISQSIGTVVEAQKGYVPPPLDGIWSRWPYLHNNSVPNLCTLLTRADKRPKSYYAGAAIDKKTDFDSECVGYPLGNATPSSWKQNKNFFYDTKREGLSNQGHDEGIFLKTGEEIFSQAEKLELIEFLKTL